MKLFQSLLLLFWIFLSVKSQLDQQNEDEDLGLYNTDEDPGYKLQTNFLKVLSAILVKTTISKNIQQAAKTVMNETLNGQPELEGYQSYMLTSMLRVINNSTGVQLRTILKIMYESSPEVSPMAEATKKLQDWLQSEDGEQFMDFAFNYVQNLFQTLKRNPIRSDNDQIRGPAFSPADFVLGNANAGQQKGKELGSNRPARPPPHQQHPDRLHPPSHRPGNNNRVPINQKPHYPERPGYPDRDHRPGHPQKPNRDRICFERVPERIRRY